MMKFTFELDYSILKKVNDIRRIDLEKEELTEEDFKKKVEGWCQDYLTDDWAYLAENIE